MTSENFDAISSGDRTRALQALRDRLGAELDEAEGTEVASLSRELRAVLLELERLGVRAEVTPLDDLASRVVTSLGQHRSRRQPGSAAS